ncbi:hypothetical protein NHX12_019704 [Muraenolepis orangiensis]|uniref:Uncharacterized protein n=1 Tax=Muraenolepis orangiensis TaxID=630683 RepID=A0A9Q0EU09_9TELE|nr:hypothetical protein NHX12_019704 [Muraenolepis orangiensis]
MVWCQWEELQKQIRRQHSWMLGALRAFLHQSHGPLLAGQEPPANQKAPSPTDCLKPSEPVSHDSCQNLSHTIQPSEPVSHDSRQNLSHTTAADQLDQRFQSDALEQLSSTLNGLQYPSTTTSLQDYEANYQELCDWLTDMEATVTDSHQLMMSEKQKDHLFKGLQLEVSEMRGQASSLLGCLTSDVHHQTHTLTHRWSQLEKVISEHVGCGSPQAGGGGGAGETRSHQAGEGGGAGETRCPLSRALLDQLEVRIKELKSWLRDTELLIFNSVCLHTDQTASLQLPCFQMGPLDEVGPEAEQHREALQLLSINLERRWEAVLMQSLQWRKQAGQGAAGGGPASDSISQSEGPVAAPWATPPSNRVYQVYSLHSTLLKSMSKDSSFSSLESLPDLLGAGGRGGGGGDPEEQEEEQERRRSSEGGGGEERGGEREEHVSSRRSDHRCVLLLHDREGESKWSETKEKGEESRRLRDKVERRRRERRRGGREEEVQMFGDPTSSHNLEVLETSEGKDVTELFPSFSRDLLQRSTSLESGLAPCLSPGELSRRTLELLKRLEKIQSPAAPPPELGMTRSVSDMSGSAASSTEDFSFSLGSEEWGGGARSGLLLQPGLGEEERRPGRGRRLPQAGDDLSMLVNVSCASCTDEDEDDDEEGEVAVERCEYMRKELHNWMRPPSRLSFTCSSPRGEPDLQDELQGRRSLTVQERFAFSSLVTEESRREEIIHMSSQVQTPGQGEVFRAQQNPSLLSQIREKILEHSHRPLHLSDGDFYSYLSLSSHDSDCGEVTASGHAHSSSPAPYSIPCYTAAAGSAHGSAPRCDADAHCTCEDRYADGPQCPPSPGSSPGPSPGLREEEALFPACTEEVYLGPPLCYGYITYVEKEEAMDTGGGLV